MPAVGLVGDTVCGHEAERLGRGHLVSVDGFDDLVLILGPERHERAGERRADGAARELVLRLGTQARAQRQATLHPVALFAEQVRDGPGRELVLVHQRPDHACLVHRGQRPRWRIGAKKQPLVCRRRLRRLDYDGYQLVPLLAPAVQALEAVDDLVPSVGRHRHAHGQIRPAVPARWRRARSQACVACAKARHRDMSDRPRGIAQERVCGGLVGGEITGHGVVLPALRTRCCPRPVRLRPHSVDGVPP